MYTTYSSKIASQFDSRFSTTFHFLAPRSPETRGERLVLYVVLILCGVVMLVLVVYYLLNPRGIVGDAFVNTASGQPMEIPPPGTFPIYVKPITLLFIAMIGFSYCFLALIQRPVLLRLPKALLTLFLLISLVLFAMSVYEVLFNFTLLSSLLSVNPNPDLAVNSYPIGGVRTNLVYATKFFVAVVFISYFSIAAIGNSTDRVKI